MLPRQKGNQWEISYRCPGYSKVIFQRFPTYEEAKRRIAEVEYEKSIGKLQPPATDGPESALSKQFITVADFLDEYVQLYGLEHWGESYLSYCRHRIDHYIKPIIGDVLLRDLKPFTLYNELKEQPAVILKPQGHR